MTSKKSIAIILFITALILTLMLPIRDQIYRDDFAYAQSVKHLVNTGEIKVTEWAAPTLILQIQWGALFSKILGFSFGALHASVITLLPLILIFTYKILRILNIKSYNALLLTILFLSIPFILQFSYTFQTDIPFLSLEIMSVYFLLKGFKENNSKNLLIGSALAAAGFIIRQIAIALIVSALLTVLLKFRNLTIKQVFKQLLAVCLIPIFVLGAYFIWLYSNDNQTVTQISYQRYLMEEIRTLIPFSNIDLNERAELGLILIHRFVAMFSLAAGLVAIPLVIIILSNLKNIKNSINKYVFLLSIVIVILIWGIDYIFFRESFVLGFPIDTFKYELLFPIRWPIVWKYLAASGISSLVIINSYKFSLVKKYNTQLIFLWLSFITLVGMSISSKFYWDRYVIVALPFFIILIGLKIKFLKMPNILFTIVVFFLLFDSLQMNKARYDINGLAQKEAGKLIDMGVSPVQIIPNEEELWVYWYTFENQIESELARVNGDKSKVVIPSVPGNLIYIKSSNGNVYLNEYLILEESSLNKIPDGFSYSILKEINIRSLFVKSKLYLVRINNIYNNSDDLNPISFSKSQLLSQQRIEVFFLPPHKFSLDILQ